MNTPIAMNKPIASMLAALLVIFLAGCVLSGSGGSVSTNTAPAGMGEYARFLPASEKELQNAVDSGIASPGHVIVKTAGDFDTSVFSRFGFTLRGEFGMGSYRYFRLEAADNTVKRRASLARQSGVIYAEHELISSIPVVREPEAGYESFSGRGAAEIAAVLNDPLTWGRFGHFETTKALEAYTTHGFGPYSVFVADIDTGINRLNEDFIDAEGNQIVEYARSAFNSTNGGNTFTFVGDGNPFVEVPVGENWDDEAHGTHTAGTIAALGNNGKGVAGVAWKKVRLISYKCFANAVGSGSDWAVYAGLKDLVDWKIANGIAMTIPVNMSLGGSYAGAFELEIINLALANGLVIVASMGNDGTVKSQFPASYAGVIAVGATRANGEKVHFSSMGKHISVMAPGYNIFSTSNFADDAYEDMSGTSMAAPFVTGTIAYMLTFNPYLTPDQIKTVLEGTAMDMGPAGWDIDTGYGQVDVKAAVGIVKNGPLPAAGSVYSTKKISVAVRNANANFDSGIAGYKSAIVGLPVYLYGSDGKYITLGVSNGTDGTTEFRNLKPGTYTMAVNYQGEKKESTVTLDNSADRNVAFSFDIPILLIQTVPNLAYDSGVTGADTVLTLYNDSGEVVAGPWDAGSLDTLSVPRPISGNTYYLCVSPYAGSTLGEYGLNIGFTGKTNVNTTTGRGAGADDSFEPNDDGSVLPLVSVGVDYGLYLGDTDWFSFVMP